MRSGGDDGPTGPASARDAPERRSASRDGAAVLAFDVHELDADRFELRRGGLRVQTQPKPLALLFYLARHRDRLVPREELVAYLWPDVVVSEDALAHAVKMAREAVGDGGRHQRVIETVRGVGFRFVAPVEEVAPTRGRRRRRTGARAGDGRGPLVGREEQLARAHAALDELGRGRGRALLYEGEAGAGKTRLLDEVAEAARAAGVRVARGTARESGGPAFAIWSDALADLFAASSDAELARLADAPWLAQLVPSLRDRVPGLGVADLREALAPEARWRLFEAVKRTLVAASDERPVALLLDDLHWADAASLRLVDFLLGDLVRRPILLVGAQRDERLAPEHPLPALVGEVVRQGVGETVRVGRLSPEAVGALLAEHAGGAAGDELVAAVHARTSGNPFLVVQVARELAARLAGEPTSWRDALARVPIPVRQVVAGRLSRLGGRARDVLGLAAMAGVEFDVALVQQAFDGSAEDVLDALEEGLALRLLEETPGTVGRLRFAHALIQEAIAVELPALRRARLHRDLALALESASTQDPEPPSATIAHHYAESDVLGGGKTAARWALRAGETAMERMAYEEAAGHYERAAALQDPAGLPPDARYGVLLGLGRARHFGLGDFVRARESFLGAVAAAREHGDAEGMAEAALAYAAIPESSVTGIDAACCAVLEESLAAQPRDAARSRARLLARLGAFFANAPERQDEAVAIAASALEIARAAGDPRVVLESLLALNRTLRLRGLAPPEERLAVTAESVLLASETGDALLELVARGQRLSPLLELGRGAELELELARYAELCERLRIPAFGWLVPIHQAMQELVRGQLASVEATALAALPLAARVPSSIAPSVLATLLFLLRREQGRLAEAEGPMRALMARFPGVAGPRAWLALLLVERGLRAEAQRVVDQLFTDGLGAFTGTEGWRPSLAMLADAVASLGDRAHAEPLLEALQPVERYGLVLGDGVLYVGPATRVMGRLAALAGRFEYAESCFAAALAQCASLGARAFAARTQLDHARALLQQGGAEHCLRADALLRVAEKEAAELGMARLLVEANAARRGATP